MQRGGLWGSGGRRAQRVPVRQEERHSRILAELVTQQAKTAWGVAEPSGDIFAGDFIDVELKVSIDG